MIASTILSRQNLPSRLLLGSLAVVLVATSFAQAATITPGVFLPTGGSAGADRFRFFGRTTDPAGAGTNYLGRDGLSTAGNRVGDAGTHLWTKGTTSVASNSFIFQYDAANDQLISTITPASGPGWTLNYTGFLANVAGLSTSPINLNTAAWNAMQISITFRDGTATANDVSLSNLKLNGTTLGTGALAGVFGGTQNWEVTGYDFRTGFTLTGNLDLKGVFGSSQEFSAVNFSFGNDPNAPVVPEAGNVISLAAISLAAGVFSLTGLRRRKDQA